MRNRLVLGVGAAALLAGASGAAAQSTVAVPGGYVTFTPAQRTYMETYVLRHPVPPAPVPGGFVAAIGEVVPQGVELRRFAVAPGEVQPGYGPQIYGPQGYDQQVYDQQGYDPRGFDQADYDAPAAPGPAYGEGYGVSGYRYVVMPGNETAVVEPRSRRIILIIE